MVAYIENLLTKIGCETWPGIWLTMKFNFVSLSQNIVFSVIKNCHLKIVKK